MDSQSYAQGQTIDEYPLTQDFQAENDDFASLKDFEDEEAIPWREVPTQIPFKILEIKTVFTSKGKSLILTLCQKDGKTFATWATKLIESKLKEIGDTPLTRYILNKGTRKSEKGLIYYDFKIICR